MIVDTERMSAEQVGVIFGCSGDNVRSLYYRKRMPRNDDMTFNLKKVWGWHYQNTIKGLPAINHRRISIDYNKLQPVELAEVLGVGRQTIWEWRRRWGLPSTRDGKYCLTDVARWLYIRLSGLLRGLNGRNSAKLRQLKRGQKECTQCRKSKLLSEFSFNKSRTDGREVGCRECSKIGRNNKKAASDFFAALAIAASVGEAVSKDVAESHRQGKI